VLIGIHINSGSEETAEIKEIMVEEGLSRRAFVDRGPIANKWNLAGKPSFSILDPGGVIRYKWAGTPGGKATDTALDRARVAGELDARPGWRV